MLWQVSNFQLHKNDFAPWCYLLFIFFRSIIRYLPLILFSCIIASKRKKKDHQQYVPLGCKCNSLPRSQQAYVIRYVRIFLKLASCKEKDETSSFELHAKQELHLANMKQNEIQTFEHYILLKSAVQLRKQHMRTDRKSYLECAHLMYFVKITQNKTNYSQQSVRLGRLYTSTHNRRVRNITLSTEFGVNAIGHGVKKAVHH